MAVLTVRTVIRAGLTPTYETAAAGGDTVANDERTFLHVKNAEAGSISVIIATPGTVDGLAITDRTVVIASGERMIGPFPRAYYGSELALTYTGVTTQTTIAAIRLPLG